MIFSKKLLPSSLVFILVEVVFKDKMACIYVGAQKTYELEFADIRVGCPKQYRCVVNKNSKIPSIDSVMESLRSIAK